MGTERAWLAPLLALAFAAGCSGEAPIDTGPRFEAAGDGCVADLETGLMWESKTLDGGLHDARATYSWYSEDRRANMSEPGIAAGGSCGLERCDTAAFVAAVNEAGLCGHHDWRMPTQGELLSLAVSRGGPHGHSLDPGHFAGTPAVEFWTGATFRLYPEAAWAVDAGTGLDRADLKSAAKPVRLVRPFTSP